jgi:hypothetical protein
MHPIVSIQATEMTRRAVRGSGPGEAVADRARRRSPRGARAGRAPRPVATINLVEAGGQAGSDQCGIAAPRRKPARA